jgi:hypothetical protein
MAEDIYAVHTEIAPCDGAEFPDDCEGAFVVCYVPASQIVESIEIATEYLESESYEVLDIDRCQRVEFEDYEPIDEDSPTIDELREALEEREVLAGPYLCYESSD